MQVILLEKVQNLGNLGEKVNVKAGYGRNFLIPAGKAIPATEANTAEFEARRAELEKVAAEKLATAQAHADKLADLNITITRKASDEGKLFGSVSNADVADAITAAGVEVSKADVRMPDGAIRATGEFEISLHFHTDVNAKLTVTVAAE